MIRISWSLKLKAEATTVSYPAEAEANITVWWPTKRVIFGLFGDENRK